MKVNRFFTTCLAIFASVSLFAQKPIILQPGDGGGDKDPIVFIVDDCFDLQIKILKIQVPNVNTIRYQYKVTNVGVASIDVRKIGVQAYLLKRNNFGLSRTPAGGRILAKNHLILEPGESVTQVFQTKVGSNPYLQDQLDIKIDNPGDCNILDNIDRMKMPELITGF